MKFSKLLTSVFLLFTIGLLVGSCSDYLDVNQDPTAPDEVPPDLQLSAVLANFSYEVVGNEPARTGLLWVQQLAYNGEPPSEDNYDYTSTGPDNLWGASYIDVLNNAKTLNQDATESDNYAYSGIAKVIMAWNYSILTDLFGSVPYSAALNATDPAPTYTPQEEIYPALLDTLDAAIQDFGSESIRTPSSDDLLYGGDMDKWEKLAYTLKARLHMHLTNASGYDANEQAQAALTALQNGFESNADDADFQYYDETGSENPWYQFAIDSKWDTRDQLSANYVDLLKSLDDPRLPIQARPVGAIDSDGPVAGFSDENPEYEGHENGEQGSGTDTISSIGEFYSAPDAPLNMLSYAEAKFIEAEATLITQGAAAAQPVYEEAVQASMNKLGVADTEADLYIASLPPLVVSNALEDIMTQKYIATFLSYEVYNDWRRTDYPEIEPVSNTPYTPNGGIPVRFPYPQSEYNNNQQNVSETGVPNNYSALEMNIWWDTD
ncbi:Starch-binding associating with outer membrane [Fodinibius roseus]|uniref:Starch-binding associating with outer membrane n=1 Tax=Fodinibius roseus TaxID=1194090 RepID=A0A1M5AMZ1_9BACT|nr:SusD/RagB family nutrient-binding outer membrane lipoprotein [Fodinibius roseus]SHF31609.1 Starch-binding associating with outer membrane [Fodinibius roseus]